MFTAPFSIDIAKGAIVKIKTTNGGETTAKLLFDYRRTYDAVLSIGDEPAIIPAYRIKSVETLLLCIPTRHSEE
ncbi:hypothetical protein [Bradyrhizobium cenepequi]|uniref:hypothetical protein n=1 Tax=Bradyrhizobium cenepequi TaxID=2821403 RepID=UPI001CE30D1A|nr:hypothetical protein [Bradyrhizobium cenepequi]MCA6108136.1 hypothetical protein [Bradyrhizobium cenepequi]